MKVPADFGDQKKVVWTIKIRGETFAIPGSLREEWQIDALEGEAGSGNTPPALGFDEGGPSGARARRASRSGDRRRSARRCRSPFCDGRWRRGRRALARRRSRHAHLVQASGAGSGHVRAADVAAHTDGRQGDDERDIQPARRLHHSRARERRSGVTAAGHAQCCWTNGYVKVTVPNETRTPHESGRRAAHWRMALPLALTAPNARRRGDRAHRAGADVHEGRRADPPGQVPGVPSAELDRADVAPHVRRCRRSTPTRSRRGRRAADAAVAHRQDRRHPGVQERPQPDRRADRDDRAAGSTRGAARATRRTCRRRAKFADPNRWQLADKMGGPPDLVIRSTPYTMPAHTQDKWYRPIDRDRADRAALGARDRRSSPCVPERPQDRPPRARVSPAGRDGRHRPRRDRAGHQNRARPVHGMGRRKDRPDFPARCRQADAARARTSAGRSTSTPMGEEVKDNHVELGVYFYPKGYVPPSTAPCSRCSTSRADRTSTFRRTRKPSRRTSTCCRRRRASRISSRTCTCAARRCRWRRSTPTAGARC